MTTQLIWPPPYTIRHSHRARQVSLRICTRRGLELIAPLGFKPEESLPVLHKHRVWIEKTWQRLRPQISNESDEPPREIQLSALNETWAVQYFLQPGSKIQLECNAMQLILRGNVTNTRLVKNVLIEWLKKQARLQLIPLLQQLSLENNFSYSVARIGSAGTRWGSCSVKKIIRLNYKLLFLSADLVRYVLLHELCHAVHLNHSRRFWELLRSVNPDCHQLRKQLRKVHVPLWLE